MSQSIPFVFLGDKAHAAKAVPFYQSIGAHVSVAVNAETKDMAAEWEIAPGSLFHCETHWGSDHKSAPVFMSATPFGGPASGHVLLVFENTPADRKHVEKLAKGLAQGGQVKFPLGPKSWGMHAYIIDQFGIHWQLTYPT